MSKIGGHINKLLIPEETFEAVDSMSESARDIFIYLLEHSLFDGESEVRLSYDELRRALRKDMLTINEAIRELVRNKHLYVSDKHENLRTFICLVKAF